jgi:hypothetical protein
VTKSGIRNPRPTRRNLDAMEERRKKVKAFLVRAF